MHLTDLLKKKIDLAQEHKTVHVFKVADAKTYPALFFSCIVKQLSSSVSIHTIDLNDDAQARATLETAFLGLSQTYWIGYVDALPKKKQQDWLDYISSYQGPNKILCAVGQAVIDTSNQLSIISIPAKIDKKLFTELTGFLSSDIKDAKRLFIDEVYKRADQLDLDSACLLVHYMQVLGLRNETFLDEWMPQLVVREQSLFQLSQYFFAKQIPSFLADWEHIKKEYGEPFWIAFWSEQLWRAAFYCKLMQEKKIAEAKKIGFRLPFSFLQKEYRNYHFEELFKAHDWLYSFDYRLKNGTDPIALDLFFYHFLADHFQESN